MLAKSTGTGVYFDRASVSPRWGTPSRTLSLEAHPGPMYSGLNGDRASTCFLMGSSSILGRRRTGAAV